MHGLSSILLLLLTMLVVQLCSVPVTVRYERVEQFKGYEIADYRNIRIRKYNRTVTVLDGTFDIHEEMNDNYSFTVRVAYSSLGNNQFITTPFRFPLQDVCQFFRTTYRDYRELYRNTSNFPDVGACPIEAKQYYIKNHVLGANEFKDFRAGLYKLTLLLYGKSNLQLPIVMVEMLVQVSREGLF
ncbi:uncharacterized protein LOC128716689 [Anopheles marshallii]|uniref:uncharacterized protein LOC128716689 n=1 Tax=Anopheles marshallii TaxID=1521116 RepID=UPI00237B0A96|nr:uncharacterized protein LOC128716689 [Anopheles marshallii]